jgi:S-DNA-T family DNA segregation ATPase FtsK/SpoIIIE
VARKNVADAAKAKAEKQKKIAIGLIVLLALAGAYAVHTMMSLNSGGGASSKPQVAATSTTGSTPVAAPVVTTPLPAAPTLSGATPTDATAAAPNGSSQLVDAVPTSAGTGQLQSFSLFESKDPFNAGGPGSTSTGTKSSTGSKPPSVSKPPKTPPAPPTPPPTAAVISVNGTSESVTTGSNFPAASPAFQLVALTGSTAKVAVAGGSYASGAATVTLKVNTPVTLVNTADGTRYTLTLLPQGTVPSAPASSAGASGATTTTPGG